MTDYSKTNIDGTKHLRFELDSNMFKDWLNDLIDNGKKPYALYFEFKRKTDKGVEKLDHIEIVPVYFNLPGNYRMPSQSLTLSISTPGVSLVSFPNGSTVTSIPLADLPDYRALEHYVDRVGFIMFGYETLKYMIDNSDHVFISSLLFDPRTFQYNANPEQDTNWPVFTLKVEIDPSPPSTPASSGGMMDNLYPPYLVGTPCTKRWYNQSQ